jgi:Putative serine esterase (DUF676)
MINVNTNDTHRYTELPTNDTSIDPKEKVHFFEYDDPKKTQGFRIKKAANTALKILAITLLVVGIAAGITAGVLAFVAASTIAFPITATVAAVAAVALAVLLTLKAWEKITPHLPNFLRVPANYLQSSILGIASAVALGVIWPFDFEKRNPKPEDINPDQPLRIAVHGFCGSSNNWVYHLNRFKEAGLDNFATINLGHPLHSMDDYVESLHNMVVEYKKGMIKAGKLKDGENLKLQLVAHSMGGLVSREYNQRYAEADGVDVLDICTLGTPLDGTRVAYLAFPSKSGRTMFHSSEFVKHQQEQTVNSSEQTRYLHVASKCDYIIRPLVSATMSNAPEERKQVEWLDATGHISYLFSDAAADKLCDYLTQHNTVATAV